MDLFHSQTKDLERLSGPWDLNQKVYRFAVEDEFFCVRSLREE